MVMMVKGASGCNKGVSRQRPGKNTALDAVCKNSQDWFEQFAH